ncbi:MAG: M57 family metalloprotease [Ferruginibacter sp.]
MKSFLKPLAFFVAISLVTVSCKRENIAQPQDEISPTVLQQIKAQGFSTQNVRKVEEGYLVEGDIILTEENLTAQSTSPNLLIANTEQYRTTNLVKGLPRTITVSISGTLSGLTVWSNATDALISRYNALGLRVNFLRAASNGDVDIVGFNQGPSGGYITLGSSGFPTRNGNPYKQIKMNTNINAYGANPNEGYITSVLQHEMGHCIGFRHTDYFNRSLSCGGAASNEGASNVGAIYIPGTPSGFDAESFMLACSAGTDRSFNPNDITALNYLY